MIDIKITDNVIMMAGDEKELNMIDKFETYKDTSACMTKNGYDFRREKNVKILKNIKGALVGFAGLSKEIITFCRNNNIKIKSAEDAREHFDFQKKEWSHDDLRKFFPKEFEYVEHQIRALQAMIKTNKGLVVATTSAGKSKVISAYIRLTKLPTLVLVNKVTLGIQLQQDLIKDGIDCGICSGKGVLNKNVMVSTIQSVKKIQNLSIFKCIIIDETHNASSKTFQDFLKTFNYPLMFGFSASPARDGKYLDYAKIRQFLGSPIVDIGSEELIENHVMAKPHIYLVGVDCEPTIDYPSAYDLGIVHNDIRNDKVCKIVDKYKTAVLILVNIIEHGEVLEKRIPGSVFISGSTPIDDRTKYLEMFEKGEIPVLIASTILQEGISVTHINCMVLACGGKSNVAIIQKIGRSLRYKKGEKTEVDYYDFVDNGNKFLLKHSKMRASLYKKNGYTDMKIANI